MDEADGTEEERVRSLAAVKRAREREKQRAKEERASGEVRKIVRDVVIPETISVADLANRMAVRGIDVVKALMRLDIMANVNHVLDAETAELIVSEFGHNAKLVSESDVEIGIAGVDDRSDDTSESLPAPPAVESLRADDGAFGVAAPEPLSLLGVPRDRSRRVR